MILVVFSYFEVVEAIFLVLNVKDLHKKVIIFVSLIVSKLFIDTKTICLI